MYPDAISRPSAGRYFPMPKGTLVRAIAEKGYAVYSYAKEGERLQLIMQNCEVICSHGYQLATFLRMGYVASFSLPEDISPQLASRALNLALGEFLALDKQPSLNLPEQRFVVFRAYLGPLSVLTVTEDIIHAGRRPYLQFRKVVQKSKSQGEGHDERILKTIQIA